MKRRCFISFCICSILFSALLLFSCGRQTVPVVDFDYPQEIELFKGQSTFLLPTIYPNNAYNFRLTYSSSNDEIAEVNRQGHVTALEYGNVTITCTVTNADGSKIEKSCEVTINDGDMYKIEIDEDTLNFEYYEGQSFEMGDTRVYACYESGERVPLEEGQYELEVPNPLTVGAVLKITYQEFTDEIPLNVVEDYILRVELTSQPIKTQYYVGEQFDPSGITIESVWASGKREVIKNFTYDNTPFDYLDSYVTINYQSFSIVIPITVSAKYQVTDYSKLQEIIDSASDGDSIMIIGTHFNVNTVYIPASKNLFIYGQTGQSVSITPRAGSSAFVVTGQGEVTFANMTLTAQDETELIVLEDEDNIKINLESMTINNFQDDDMTTQEYILQKKYQ